MEIWERMTLRRWAAMQNEGDRAGQQVVRSHCHLSLVWEGLAPRTRSNPDETEGRRRTVVVSQKGLEMAVDCLWKRPWAFFSAAALIGEYRTSIERSLLPTFASSPEHLFPAHCLENRRERLACAQVCALNPSSFSSAVSRRDSQ
jgi:hypothetical protein